MKPLRILSLAALFSFGTTLPALAADVRAFGAKGDGQTDDTAAVQKAVNESTDGEVRFPRGDYRITKTIEVKLAERGRTSLSGATGVGRVIMAGSGPAFRFTGTHTGSANPGSFKPGVLPGERMPQIDGLEIVGAHEEADGIEFVQVMQPTLRAVFIREVRHGVRLFQRDRNVLIDSCHIYNCRGVGVFFDHVNLHQTIIHGSHISYCKGGGIKIVASEIRNFQITGNDIEYNYDTNAVESADIWFDVTEGSVREGTIASNTIQAKVSPGGANIRFVGHADTPNKVGLWTIVGNHISNQEVNIHLKNARGVSITGNSFCLGAKHSFLVEGSQNIVIGSNSIDRNPDYYRSKDTWLNGITLRGCEGVVLSGTLVDGAESGSEVEGGAIELFNCRQSTVANCQIINPKFRGIYIADSINAQVHGCTVVDWRVDGSMLMGVQVTGQSKGTLISGNLVGKGTKGSVVAAPFTAVVENNPLPAK